MRKLKQDSIILGTNKAAKPAWMVWGTANYEELLAARYPHANRSTIKSLIKITRRIVATEKRKMQ